MKTYACQPGAILEAMRRHHASQAVEVEAAALEHELRAEHPDRQVLLRLARGFARQYPAILLREQQVLSCILGACLEAVNHAGEPLGSQARLVLLEIIVAVAEQALREDPQTVPARVPRLLGDALGSVELQHASRQHLGELVEQLLAIGRQVALVGEEGNPPQPWFELLAHTTRQALLVCRRRLYEQFTYDGRLEAAGLGQELGSTLLARLNQEQLDADGKWLDELRRQFEQGARPAVDVFLELYTWRRRSAGDDLWQEWLGQVAARAVAGELSRQAVDAALALLADLLGQTRDRRFLHLLVRSLQRHLPYLLAAGRRPGNLELLARASREQLPRLAEDDELRQELLRLAEQING
ncbi:MAG: hypothetical protein DRI34_00620 [Deltaproteobacteria bacterium]|nr:MAG: hypothetical protein DRI34_00620 [Deltaproteobacteria bacterium]